MEKYIFTVLGLFIGVFGTWLFNYNLSLFGAIAVLTILSAWIAVIFAMFYCKLYLASIRPRRAKVRRRL